MQDIHTIGVGGGGRLFGGAERRLRPHHHHLHGGSGGGQTLKCPRCDSVNTKFCYYNNYNLSQPRHFCKSCRRYWTKGGVLRNVPVGGGCRKTKRKTENGRREGKRENENNSSQQSSSESSSLTASAVASAEIVSDSAAPSSKSDISPSAQQILAPSLAPETLDFSQPNPNPILDNITSFSDPSDTCEIGTFTSMMTSSSNPMMMGFDFSYRLPLQSDGKIVENPTQWSPRQQEDSATRMPDELKMGFLDPTVQMDLSGRMDHELFDLTATVDPTYWSQPQWTDINDHPLYLP